MTIGERAYKAISDYADQKGVGIVEYAKSIGISQPNLSHWKNAHCEPRAYLLSLLAEAGLDVHWILTGQRVDNVVDDYNFVQTVLLTAPTIEAAPVVHGRWEKHEPDQHGNRKPKCSVCGEYHLAWWSEHTRCNYCPNCGARMDGDGNA